VKFTMLEVLITFDCGPLTWTGLLPKNDDRDDHDGHPFAANLLSREIDG
jgi:hypothetical protein